MFFKDRYVDRELSNAVTLNHEWLELTLEVPLKIQRKAQELTFYPEPSIKMIIDHNAKGGLVPAVGRSATIEAELTDSKGETYHSSPGVSETMTGDLEVITRSLKFKDLPKDAVFKTVRIRSNAAYPVKKSLWRCYNWAEVHK
ncbi:MAG TPA: hypothetical protein VF692_08760 [Pyrinomonadaceae bacterium]|jgi:hypothetical protein